MDLAPDEVARRVEELLLRPNEAVTTSRRDRDLLFARFAHQVDPTARHELDILFARPPHQADTTRMLIRQFLWSHPGICEHQNEHGYLPLHTAVERGCPLAILELLVSAYPEALNCTTRLGWMPLHIACVEAASTNLEVFHLLATPAAIVSNDDDDRLPMHYYCQRVRDDGYALDTDALELLMGGDPNLLLQVDIGGDTPLHTALSRVVLVDAPAIQWLVKVCPPQALTMRNEDGLTPLQISCYYVYRRDYGDDDEIIQLLASECTEATMLATDRNGDTALHLYCDASRETNPLTLQALLQACPQSAHQLNDKQEFPVELVFQNFLRGNLFDVRELALLIDAFGEDLLTIRAEGKTVLHRAIDSSLDVEIIRILASKFKSFLEGNHEDGNILHYLCAKTGLEASYKVAYLKVLVTACELAVSARNDQGETALHILCNNEEATAEQLEILATSELAVSARDPQGKTPLHVLCSNNNVAQDLLQVLLDMHPGLAMTPDDMGQLPLHKMAVKEERVAARPTFKAALHRLRTAFPPAIHARDSRAGLTPLEVAHSKKEDASLTLVYLLFRFDPAAALISWQGASVVDEG